MTDTVSGTNQFSATGSLLVGSAGIADGTNASANLTSTNLISSENIFDGAKGTCGESDLTSLFSGQGSASNSITSGGGNLSDDTSLSQLTKIISLTSVSRLRHLQIMVAQCQLVHFSKDLQPSILVSQFQPSQATLVVQFDHKV